MFQHDVVPLYHRNLCIFFAVKFFDGLKCYVAQINPLNSVRLLALNDLERGNSLYFALFYRIQSEGELIIDLD